MERRVTAAERAIGGQDVALPDAILRRGADGIVRDARGEPVDLEAWEAAAWEASGIRPVILVRRDADG